MGQQAANNPEAFVEHSLQTGWVKPEKLVNESIEVGKQISWEIALAHGGLVHYVVSKYRRSIARTPAIDFEDLMNEGQEAVFRSAGKYYPKIEEITEGTFFFTHIKNAVEKCIDDTSSAVRIPRTTRKIIGRMDGLVGHRNPATGKGITPRKAFEIVKVSHKRRQEIERARLLSQEMGSLDGGFSPQLDNPSGNRYSSNLNNIFYPDQQDPLEAVEQRIRNMQIRGVVRAANLSEREVLVLNKRFGFNGEPPLTLDEVGELVGVSRHRIQRIEAKALAKLRHPKNSSKLTTTEEYQVFRERITRDPEGFLISDGFSYSVRSVIIE